MKNNHVKFKRNTQHLSQRFYDTFLYKTLVILIVFNGSIKLYGQIENDTLLHLRPFVYQLGIETRPGIIFSTNPFLRGDNYQHKPIEAIYSTHLRYSFQFQPYTYTNRIYKGVYQGIGAAHYIIDNMDEVGRPVALYLFQGATLAQISRTASLNYEWNFGLSGGWKTYHAENNPNNGMMGSRVNAYMNINFYMKHYLNTEFDLTYGLTLTHFSNGNTSYPNAGLNATDIKIGLSYNFNRNEKFLSSLHAARALTIERFPKHISTDVVLFGSWRRKGIIFNEEPILSPHRYHVAGININPMFNVGYNTRLGISIDGVYDSSANIYTEDYIKSSDYDPGYTFYYPSLNEQIAIGTSARIEYIMPFLTVGLGFGKNIIYKGEDFNGFYQVFLLKTEITRSSFLHIGYNLQNFKTPNYLMLGFGYRFGNRYPRLYR